MRANRNRKKMDYDDMSIYCSCLDNMWQYSGDVSASFQYDTLINIQANLSTHIYCERVYGVIYKS